MLTYGTVCDGISATSAAWAPLGMRCAWRSEIAPFPSAVAAARHPGAPNLGDFTRIGIDEAPPEPVDILVGGTPCQSFSVAGGRAGLDDPRGHLAVEFLLLARRLGARWVVWENVADTLSVDGGDAFATLLRLMVECGYGVAWRILDAQFFGVPQRRRRVFVVGHLGDWRPPVAVLLERPSLRRDPRSSSPAGTGVAVPVGAGASGGDRGGERAAHTITTRARTARVEDTLALAPGVIPIQDAQRTRVRAQHGMGIGDAGDPMFTVTTRADHGVFVFDQVQITHPENRARVHPGGPAPTIAKHSRPTLAGGMRPRRLTPLEHERCFGFPDGYTAIDFEGKPAADTPRYEALGNSMAVPVMAWIGRRLLLVEQIRQAA